MPNALRRTVWGHPDHAVPSTDGAWCSPDGNNERFLACRKIPPFPCGNVPEASSTQFMVPSLPGWHNRHIHPEYSCCFCPGTAAPGDRKQRINRRYQLPSLRASWKVCSMVSLCFPTDLPYSERVQKSPFFSHSSYMVSILYNGGFPFDVV